MTRLARRKPASKPTCKEIAARIDAHLQRFERDPKINKRIGTGGDGSIRMYWQAGAWASGGWVGVRYIAYQSNSKLTKADAEKYLAWLDAGNAGRHWTALRPAAV